MKVTSALLVALGFVERNSTKPDCGPNAREIVKTSVDGQEIILDGSVDEVVAETLASGTDLPTFIEILMGQAAELSYRAAQREFANRVMLASLLASFATNQKPSAAV
jgi:hypothetical protein